MRPAVHAAAEAVAEPDAREPARRMVVRLVMLIYLLLVVEGALRKWAFPQVQQYLYFVRDPFAIAAIGLAFHARLIPSSRLLQVLVVALVALCGLACYQIVADGYLAIAAALGLRNYFLFAFLALVIRHVFTRDDLLRILRVTLFLAVPMAVVSVAQFASPASAYINKSYSDGEVFTVANGIVRTTGTFTFNTGMACFIASAVACLAASYYQHFRERTMPALLLAAAAGAVFTCLAVSGNRTAFMHSGVIVTVMVLAELAKPARNRRFQILIGLPVLLAIMAGLMMAFFGDALTALLQRQANASASGEDFLSRVADIVFGGFAVFNSISTFGVGIGSLGPGGASLTGGVAFGGGSEYEFPRVLFELGFVLGSLYMALRWALVVLLLISALRCLRRNDDAIPLMMWAMASVLLVSAHMTSQTTVNGYGWLFTGFALAAIAVSVPSAGAVPARRSTSFELAWPPVGHGFRRPRPR